MSNELANMKKLLYRTISSEYTIPTPNNDGNIVGDNCTVTKEQYTKLVIDLFNYLKNTQCVVKIHLTCYDDNNKYLGDSCFTFHGCNTSTQAGCDYVSSEGSIGYTIPNTVDTKPGNVTTGHYPEKVFTYNLYYSIIKDENNNDYNKVVLIINNFKSFNIEKIKFHFDIINGNINEIFCTDNKEHTNYQDGGTLNNTITNSFIPPVRLSNNLELSLWNAYDEKYDDCLYSNGSIYSGRAGTTNSKDSYTNLLDSTGIYIRDSSAKNMISLQSKTGEVKAQSFNAQSDKRLKTNITDYSSNKSILDLPIKEFDYITTGKHAIGCIAQDLQEICPEIVNTDENGYLSIQESKIVYLLLDEVKKLRAELDELKGR